MKPIAHLIISGAVLVAVCAAMKSTAEPRRDHSRDPECSELTFAPGRLHIDADGCREIGGRDRDWRHRGDRHWGADAVLFDHSGFRGAALPLRGDMPDLSAYDFDDRASSILVRRGRWEGCTETGYRGRCWRVSDDDGGFHGEANNRIRSIRRVR